MSNMDYMECRKMLLGQSFYNLLQLGCPVDEFSLKRRVLLLQNAGIPIQFESFLEILGLEDGPNKGNDTFQKIQNRMGKIKQICKDIDKCKIVCQDLEDLEFE